MNIHSVKDADDLIVNAELARAIGGKKAQIHVFAGKNGYRVKLLTKGGKWHTVNWRRKFFSHNVEKALGCEVTKDDSGGFLAKVPGTRVSVGSDDRQLAVALAAAKAMPLAGLRVLFLRSEASTSPAAT